ncbi:hypothetical protein [Burkholderia ambifaria]|uniref:hypothetical protein n=1 Tax=Burkholderia ambifaria TaxID=152480 RepID=UPI000F7FBAB0|nr:hypothetical protein [Burkholderia ambifaria]
MSKRDLIAEIQEKNARASREYLHGNLELFDLEASFSRLGESDSAMLALHVMGIASCIEVSVREAIKRLIDSGDPYFERAEFFKDHIRFDYLLTKALSTGKITFGDLISHSLPVSRLDHIASHFEVLFNDKGGRNKFQKIMSDVRRYVEPSDDELFGNEHAGHAQQSAPFLLVDSESLLKDIASIFEVRHLVAHEAHFKVVRLDELSRFLRSARLFVDALYELVEQILSPGVSRNSFGGSIQQMAKAEKVREAAQVVHERILEKIPSVRTEQHDLLDLFNETVRAFDSYHEAESNFRLALHGIATGNAMRNIEANVTTQLWRHRKDYLIEVQEHVDFYAGLHNG